MYRKKSILVVIPARGGSKGIKLKNLKCINGTPLIGIVGNLLKNTKIFDRVIASTDHPKIAKVALEYDIDVPFMRPKKLSGDLISDIDVLYHALKETENIDQVEYDIVVMLQPTSPLRKLAHIKNCIDKLINNGYDSVWTISKNDSKNHPLKQLTLKNNKINLYDKAGESIIARQQLNPLYFRNGIAYVLTRDCLINKKKLMTQNTGAVLVNELSINIDTMWDLKLAEFLSSKKQN